MHLKGALINVPLMKHNNTPNFMCQIDILLEKERNLYSNLCCDLHQAENKTAHNACRGYIVGAEATPKKQAL